MKFFGTKDHSSKAPFYLHVGLPKTATSYLQDSIFKLHSQVYYLGKLEGTIDEDAKLHGQYADDSVLNLIRFSCQDILKLSKSDKRGLAFHSHRAKQTQQTVVLSKEGLVGLAQERRERFFQTLNDCFGPVELLLNLREPLSFTEALYFQAVKAYQFGRSKKFIQHFKPAPYLFDINEWLEAMLVTENGKGTPLTRFLSYGETALAYRDLLGKERVHLLLFEQLKQNPVDYWWNLSQSVGIDFQETLELSKHQAVNVRWSQETIDRLRGLETGSEESRARFRASENAEKIAALGLLKANKSHEGKNPRASISPEFQKKILEHTSVQNEMIEQEFGISLRKYGYQTLDNSSSNLDHSVGKAA